MNFDAVKDVARSILMSLGGLAVAKGYVDESTLSAVVGAIFTLVSFGWSLAAKK